MLQEIQSILITFNMQENAALTGSQAWPDFRELPRPWTALALMDCVIYFMSNISDIAAQRWADFR